MKKMIEILTLITILIALISFSACGFSSLLLSSTAASKGEAVQGSLDSNDWRNTPASETTQTIATLPESETTPPTTTIATAETTPKTTTTVTTTEPITTTTSTTTVTTTTETTPTTSAVTTTLATTTTKATTPKVTTTTKATTTKANTTTKATTTAKITTTNATTTEKITEETRDSDNGGQVMVWIPTNGGTKYHKTSTCSSMIDPEYVTLDEAIRRGFTACKRNCCYG